MYSEKATKILRNLPLTFDYSAYGQKLGEDFAKFCGLLRIYELYFPVYCYHEEIWKSNIMFLEAPISERAFIVFS